MTRAVAAAALAAACAGCGNYSTEDLRFLAALPRSDDLRVAVPAQGEPQALVGPCSTGTADVWLSSKPTSDGLNALVELLAGLVDRVRRLPPTWRHEDERGWGPFDDDRHPNREIQVVITRSFPFGPDGAPRHAYRFEARVKGTAAFTPVIGGTFDGASASRGRGTIVLDFDAIWALAMNDATTPRGTMQVAYDRTSEPVTVDLSLTQDGFGIVRFDYGFAGYRDGSGAFDFAFRNAAGDLLTVATGFDRAGAGRGRTSFTAAGGGSGQFRQCWDDRACLTFVDDPANFTCVPPGPPPCSFGAIAGCPAVPAGPF